MGIEERLPRGPIISKDYLAKRTEAYMKALANLRVIGVYTEEQKLAILEERARSVEAIRNYNDQMAYEEALKYKS